MAAVRRSHPGLLPATHHTFSSASLLPALTLIGPLSNSLHLTKQAEKYSLPRLVLCWLREQARFTEGSGKRCRQQEREDGSRLSFQGQLAVEPRANAK